MPSRDPRLDQRYVFDGPILFVTLEFNATKSNGENNFLLEFGGFGNELKYSNRTFSHFHYKSRSGNIDYPGGDEHYKNNEVATFVINPLQTLNTTGFHYAGKMEKSYGCGDSLAVYMILPDSIIRYGHLRYSYRYVVHAYFTQYLLKNLLIIRICNDIRHSQGRYAWERLFLVFVSDNHTTGEGFSFAW